jgi:hypothetical protein
MEDTLPNMSLEDTNAQLNRGVLPVHGNNHTGIDPYDTFPTLGGTSGKDRNAELRRLSAWIRQKRDVARLKAEEESPDKSGKKERK